MNMNIQEEDDVIPACAGTSNNTDSSGFNRYFRRISVRT